MGPASTALCTNVCCLGFWLQQGLLPTSSSAARMQQYTYHKTNSVKPPSYWQCHLQKWTFFYGSRWETYDWELLVQYCSITAHSKLPHHCDWAGWTSCMNTFSDVQSNSSEWEVRKSKFCSKLLRASLKVVHKQENWELFMPTPDCNWRHETQRMRELRSYTLDYLV